MIQLNKKSRNMKLTRGEVCDLLLLLSVQDGGKWKQLREKIKDQLDDQDKKEQSFKNIKF